jgi:hypothetical protein
MSTPPPGISSADWALTPPTVRLMLLAVIEQQHLLAARITDLEAQLATHSGNSSKPPSADPPSAPPKPPKPKTNRNRGAQKGHPGTHRPLLPPDDVSEFIIHRPSICSCCHTNLPLDLAADAIERHQVWELPSIRPIVTEHQLVTLHCPSCHTPQRAEWPGDVPPGAFGATVTALVAVLRGRYHLSARAVVSLLDEVLGIPLSLGSVPRLQEATSVALAPVYDEVRTAVRRQAVLNVDETGWQEAGTQRYLWVAVSRVGSVFQVERRTQAALTRLLGAEYCGIVGSDRYGAYSHIPLERRQICWAHLKRDWMFYAERDGPVGEWGEAGVEQIRALFEVWHRFRAGECGREGMQGEMKPIQGRLRSLLDEGRDSLPWEKARGFCRELGLLWEGLWTFVEKEGVEPTNNAAEQDVRPAVLWRKGSYGTQSEAGSRFVERILTVVTTARRQGRNVLAFVADALRASWAGQSAPLLIPTS